jgi:hypothetical protein
MRLPNLPMIALVVKGNSDRIDRARAAHWLRCVSDAAMRDMACAA